MLLIQVQAAVVQAESVLTEELLPEQVTVVLVKHIQSQTGQLQFIMLVVAVAEIMVLKVIILELLHKVV
tara:strand:- start:57 stop:263 length:207 start_codon:yes stop_codon:yes gene_type:complete